MKKKNISKKIPLQLYKKIVDLMPLCCVDAVLKVGNKAYLFKRAYNPVKNRWWIIGGRILKGETAKHAAVRKVKQEAGIGVKILKKIGAYEVFLPKNRFGNGPYHAIAVCFLVAPKNKSFKLKINEEYTCYKTITKIEKNLHPYVKQVLKDSGVFKR